MKQLPSPRAEFVALGQRVISDTTTYTLSIVDVIENFNILANAFPPDEGASELLKWHQLSPCPQVLVIFEWDRDRKNAALVEQQIVTPTGRTHLISFLQPFVIEAPDVNHDRPRARGTWPLEAMPLDMPGRYEYQILIDKKVAAAYAFSVNKIAVEVLGLPPTDASKAD